jgi:hypothetical protein
MLAGRLVKYPHGQPDTQRQPAVSFDDINPTCGDPHSQWRMANPHHHDRLDASDSSSESDSSDESQGHWDNHGQMDWDN